MKPSRFLVHFLLLISLFTLAVSASESYTINGVTVSYDSVEWPGAQGCWEYANGIYQLIWGVSFDNSFNGTKDTGNNLLQALNDDQRLFTPEHTEIFIKSAVPGAVIRLTNALQADPTFDSDGLQADGTYGHNVIIAAIYDEGFVAFESLATGTRQQFYTWQEFYETWSADYDTAPSHYRYYKYVKWPNAPTLQLQNQSPVNTDWGVFLLLCLGVAAFSAIFSFLLWLIQRKYSLPVSFLPAVLLMLVLPFCFGLFFVWTCAAVSLLLILYLIYLAQAQGFLHIAWNEQLILSVLLPAFYLLSSIWAVDRGLAPMGIVKLLPLPLFTLVLQQLPQKTQKQLRSAIPLSGGIMVLLSALLLLLPTCRSWLLIDGRLAGFFQYPNAFALFLLVGLLLLCEDGLHWKKIPLGAVLMIGILAAGSRTIYVLTAVLGVLYSLTSVKRKHRLISLGAVLTALAIAAVGALLLPASPLGRLLTISTSSSTFLGRLLYFQDVLPVILHHPLGLGYLGYYYSQGTFQTGVYSAMFVHNELLQFLVDIGWLPALAAAVILLRQLLAKGISWPRRLAMLAILAHSMFDFSLQFTVTWLILLLLGSSGRCFAETTWKPHAILPAMGAVLSALCVSLGTASWAERYTAPDTALSIYPNDTPALCDSLLTADTPEDMDTIAQRILTLDASVSMAHSAAASVALYNGDIPTMISEKQLAIACAPYDLAEYQDYLDKLKTAMELCIQQGAENEAALCRTQLLEIPAMLENQIAQTSVLGWKIHDQPNLALTGEETAYLASLE